LLLPHSAVTLAPGEHTDPGYGEAGYLNLPAALNSTAAASGPTLSPTLYQYAYGDPCVDTNRIIWGVRVFWGVNTDAVDMTSTAINAEQQ